MQAIKPLVSVIIPCYNAEQFVEVAVRSIMNQTYKEIEIICIDDGATDHTAAILRKLAIEDSRIKIYTNEQNLRLIATLNKAIALAKGDYIARMDADDIAVTNRIELQVKILEEQDIDICGTKINYITFKGHFHSIQLTHCFDNEALRFVSMFEPPLRHPSVTGKASAFKNFHYGTEVSDYLIEDYALWCRMLNNGIKMQVLFQTLLLYRRSPQGESMSKHEKQQENAIQYAQQQQAFLLDESLSRESLMCIISTDKGVFNSRLIGSSFQDLDRIKEQFIGRYKPSPCAEHEINTWINQRKLRLCLGGLINGSRGSRLEVLKLCLWNINLFFSIATIQGMYNRVLWAFAELKKER